ncbi:hypothetical protein KIW84_066559 [Lathyrus oleraceus]|uniref:Uncharacterized protein n=1 Tax=Pisum sativum TaxID=3888 RepID=A0A9D4WI34_PEA|nr:hypothetical protein KIW84_066559 [Pisum sativum]
MGADTVDGDEAASSNFRRLADQSDNEWIVNYDEDFENEILHFTIENEDFEAATAEGGNGINVATIEGGNEIEFATTINELEIHNLDDEFDGEEDSRLDDQNALKD